MNESGQLAPTASSSIQLPGLSVPTQQCYHYFFLTRGRREGPRLRDLGSKPAWWHTPSGEAAVGAGLCVPSRAVVSPGWASRPAAVQMTLPRALGLLATVGFGAACLLFLETQFPCL